VSVTLSNLENLVGALAQLKTAAEQRALFASAEVEPSQPLVECISAKITELLPRDLESAKSLSETNLSLALRVNTPAAQAYADRSLGQVFHAMRKCVEAEPYFDRAVELFDQARLDAEVGRTLIAKIDNLMYLSRYPEALKAAEQARMSFDKANDETHVPRLHLALGNLYFRLNKYRESLAHYDLAQLAMEYADDTLALASIGLNRAHVLTEMNRFDEAVQAFKLTREYCARPNMTRWAATADRAIAQMHFKRGNYSTALQILERVRRKYEEMDDVLHAGLCDVDRAEIYLELNLFDDAANIARRAFEVFRNLDNKYDAARCLAYEGIAEFKLFNDKEARRTLLTAHKIFLEEGNEFWIAIIDVWLAQLLTRQQEFSQAQELAQKAAEVFEKQHAPVRAANARVLAAQNWLASGEKGRALREAQKALSAIANYHAPWVSFQCHNTLGRIKELNGATEAAEQLYLQAVTQMESLRGNIRLDEMRMSFGRDKHQVYENLVNLMLSKGDRESAFQFVERSKSRSLIDLLENNLETAWDAGAGESPKLQRIRQIREELNILYSRLNEIGATLRSVAADTETQDEIGQREQQLLQLMREVGSEKSGWVTLQNLPIPAVNSVQAMLQPDEVLVEYYSIGDRLEAFIVTPEKFECVRNLTTLSAVRNSLKGLTFQLSKFHLQPNYVQGHAAQLMEATRHHLHDLYRQLIEPMKDKISAKSWITIPHQLLHYVPFAALYDGERYLIDEYDFSQAPSVSVLKICREKKIQKTNQDLVLAVGDETTPYINEEVAALRELLPNGLFFLGSEAREDKLRQHGQTADKLHIAAHGIFRADNPMFSSLKLGDSWLNLFDIFNLQLGAELTVLSACETGRSAVWEGDELLGLARGFLYAGTPSLIVSLWMVHDRSTALLMRRFYEGLQRGLSKARALQVAMIAVKAVFPHPYYWAPFILTGRS